MVDLRRYNDPMRVYLVRHGQTAWNAQRKNQGHTDIPLDQDGEEQARLLSFAFDDRPVTRIFSSDLQRARMTAAPIAQRLGVPVVVRESLRERCFGDWEAQPMEKVAESFIRQGMLSGLPVEEVRPPNGESLADVWKRLEEPVTEIEACAEPVLVIIHGGSGGLVLSRLLRGTISTARSFRFDNTGVTTVARRPDGGFHLIGYNDAAHLRETPLSGSSDGALR